MPTVCTRPVVLNVPDIITVGNIGSTIDIHGEQVTFTPSYVIEFTLYANMPIFPQDLDDVFEVVDNINDVLCSTNPGKNLTDIFSPAIASMFYPEQNPTGDKLRNPTQWAKKSIFESLVRRFSRSSVGFLESRLDSLVRIGNQVSTELTSRLVTSISDPTIIRSMYAQMFAMDPTRFTVSNFNGYLKFNKGDEIRFLTTFQYLQTTFNTLAGMPSESFNVTTTSALPSIFFTPSPTYIEFRLRIADNYSFVNVGEMLVMGNINLGRTLLPSYQYQLLSTSAQTSLNAAYSTQLINSAYNGPILQIRRNMDDAIQDFYSDADNTNLSTNYGISLLSWLGGSQGNVVTWYDQSGSGNHAIQQNTALQPTITPSDLVVFMNSTAFLVLPDGTIPSGTSPYSFVAKHTSYTTNGTLLSSTSNILSITSTSYANMYGSPPNEFAFGSPSPENVVYVTYDGSNRKGFVNGTAMSSLPTTPANVISTNNTMGERMEGGLKFVYIFSSALSTTDIGVINS